MKDWIRKSFKSFPDRIFGFLLIGFLGFTVGSIVFIKFGHYTWSVYWIFSKLFLIAFALIISIKLIVDIARR